MNAKQQCATGILAMIIVASVALMPVSAEVKDARVSMVRESGKTAAALNSAELPQDQVRDLTYN